MIQQETHLKCDRDVFFTKVFVEIVIYVIIEFIYLNSQHSLARKDVMGRVGWTRFCPLTWTTFFIS